MAVLQAQTTPSSDIRLQQSLSTPVPGGGPGAGNGPGEMNGSGGNGRKDSEYRRYKSEGMFGSGILATLIFPFVIIHY